ncbi:MAG: NAD-binding protein [Actinobacteria bacterium]|nr:NAD-binding protein [Actinomycetota bacterium]
MTADRKAYDAADLIVWSGTGNSLHVAERVAESARKAGTTARVFAAGAQVDDGFSAARLLFYPLILGAMGVALGHLGTDILSLITMVCIMTISISVYMILGADRLYDYVQRPLKIFERKVPFREIEESLAEPARVDVIVLGLGRYGGTLADGLMAKGFTVLGVDFDPQALKAAKERGVPVQYGDADDPEFTGSLPLSSADVVVSTLPSLDINKVIVHGLQSARFKGRFVATAHDESEIEPLKAAGAYHVLMPFMDAAEQAVETVASDVHPEVGVARA